MLKKRKLLGEILYRAGLINEKALGDALVTAKAHNQRLGQTLVELGLVSEENVTKAIAKQFGLEYIDLDRNPISSSTMKLIPDELIKKHNVLPLGMNNGRMKIAISDPLDLDTLDLLRFRLNTELECSLASLSKIRGCINRSMDEVKSSIDATAAELTEAGHVLEAEIRKAEAAIALDDEGPIIKLVSMIIDEAYHMRASDIHIEPMSDRVRVRYRVDGVCLERDNIPKSMQAPLLARLKILSGMDIGERRLPQDGRIKKLISNQDIDFRVSDDLQGD